MGLLLWFAAGAGLGALAAYVQIENNGGRWDDEDAATHVIGMAAICSFLGPFAIGLVLFCHLISKDGP